MRTTSGGGATGTGTADLAGLLHDIQQPLAVIRLLTEVETDGGMRARLDEIGVQAMWALAVIEEVLRPSDPESHLANPAAAVDRVVARYARFGATITTHVEARPVVHATQLVLERTMQSVVDNAVRAAGPDGRVDVVVLTEHDELLILVVDDGPGFGRIESSTGFGLTVASHLVATSGGRLTIYDRPGHGCAVELAFRLADQAG